MGKDEIISKIEIIFAEVLKKDNVLLFENTTAKDVEGWDSLTNMTIMSEVEKVFGIRFSFREIIKLKNIGDLCRLISEKTVN